MSKYPKKFLAFIKGTGEISVLEKQLCGSVNYAGGVGCLKEEEYEEQDPLELIAEIYNRLERERYD